MATTHMCGQCGSPCDEHDCGDVVGCIARARGRHDHGDPLREKLHVSLRASLDYTAALALFWWIRDAAARRDNNLWPWTWERPLYDLVFCNRQRDEGEPDRAACAEARVLKKASGGWWWVDDAGDPVFTVEMPAA